MEDRDAIVGDRHGEVDEVLAEPANGAIIGGKRDDRARADGQPPGGVLCRCGPQRYDACALRYAQGEWGLWVSVRSGKIASSWKNSSMTISNRDTYHDIVEGHWKAWYTSLLPHWGCAAGL